MKTKKCLHCGKTIKRIYGNQRFHAECARILFFRRKGQDQQENPTTEGRNAAREYESMVLGYNDRRVRTR